MQEKTDTSQPQAIVLGAGAGGFSAALALADKGYFVELIEKETLGSGASGRNPGRMGHGFHYTDIKTAIAYLHASINVQKTHPGFLVDQELPFDAPRRHGRYFITKDSSEPVSKILATYRIIQAEYQRLVEEDPANKVFGEPEHFFRILDPSEYQGVVNSDLIALGIETAEHLFKWPEFAAHIKKKVLAHPNIRLREHTEVIQISRNPLDEPRFKLSLKTKAGESFTLNTDYLINSTWQEIERLNDSVGLRMIPGERTNRLKTLLVLELPESLEHANSMFFCMGQHCMISNLGNRRAMATYAKLTNMEASSGLTVSATAQALLDGKIDAKQKEQLARQMLEGISHYIPDIAHAKIVDLQFGIVQTAGKLSLEELDDPTHPFHQRADHRVRTEQIGLISNPCMKFFYFVDNGQIVAELMDEHVQATQLIKQTMGLVKEKAQIAQLRYNPVIERAIYQQLERYNYSKLQREGIESLANTLVNTLASKASLQSFFATQSAKKDKEDDCLRGVPRNV